MGNSQNTSEKLEMNYVANAALVMIFCLLGFVALVDFNSLTICLMALTISIVYVGLQISRVAGRLHQ